MKVIHFMNVNGVFFSRVRVASYIFILTLFIFVLSSIKVYAQGNSSGAGNGGGFRGGGNGNIPCQDSTPFCPCVLPNGDCFDIDTPIDDDLKLLILAGVLIGVYKLNSIRKLQLNR
jgi:hypothetical protein